MNSGPPRESLHHTTTKDEAGGSLTEWGGNLILKTIPMRCRVFPLYDRSFMNVPPPTFTAQFLMVFTFGELISVRLRFLVRSETIPEQQKFEIKANKLVHKNGNP